MSLTYFKLQDYRTFWLAVGIYLRACKFSCVLAVWWVRTEMRSFEILIFALVVVRAPTTGFLLDWRETASSTNPRLLLLACSLFLGLKLWSGARRNRCQVLTKHVWLRVLALSSQGSAHRCCLPASPLPCPKCRLHFKGWPVFELGLCFS